jgi:dCTP deaminase
MILNDKQITELCENQDMLYPFCYGQIKRYKGVKMISYGVSSFGYDIRLAPEVKLFTRSINNSEFATGLLDPKNFKQEVMKVLEVHENETGSFVILPPYSFALGSSIEYFKVPDNVMCLCTCKSTLARVGLNINNTTFEPGFEGDITLELTNPTDHYMKLYVNEGVAQVLFIQGERPEITYADKEGKYQKQKGIQGALV